MLISLLVLTTLTPFNILANESSDDSQINKIGDTPTQGKVIVVYEAQSPNVVLKEIELTGDVGDSYTIPIEDFEGYTFTYVAPPEGGHAQIEGVFEEQDQHAYIFYESNTFSTITLRLAIQDNQNNKGHRPDFYKYSIYRIDPTTGIETVFLTEELDVTDVSGDYLRIEKEISGLYPRFNSEGKKYEYRLETQEMSYYKNIVSDINFDYWDNDEMIVSIAEEGLADNVDLRIYKRFGSDMDTRRRMMASPSPKVTPPTPEFVTIHVKRDSADIEGSPFILNYANYWEITLENLPNIDSSGKEIEYEVVEVPLEGFLSTVSVKRDDTNSWENKRYVDIGVVNSYVVDVTATKVWVNAPTVKPDVTFQLYESAYDFDHELGEEVEVEVPVGSPVVLKDGEVSYTWNNLEKYEKSFGDTIERVYKVKEIDVPQGYEVTYSDDKLTITNTYTGVPEEPTVDVAGTKTWDDDNDAEGKRPASITVKLLKNGTIIDSQSITEADSWKYSFTGLDKSENGIDIEYTISEEEVIGYEVSYQGYDITNTYIEEPVDPVIPVDPPVKPITPTEPESPQLPQTGVNTNHLGLYTILVGALLLGFRGSERYRRETNKK